MEKKTKKEITLFDLLASYEKAIEKMDGKTDWNEVQDMMDTLRVLREAVSDTDMKLHKKLASIMQEAKKTKKGKKTSP
jgi:hypothetical protein